MSSLFDKPNEISEMKATLQKLFSPSSNEALPLEKRLKLLSKTELQVVLQTAQMVKMAHQFGNNKTRPYKGLIRSMYGKLPYSIQIVIADVLQEAEPIDAKPTPVKSRDELTQEVLESYREVS